MSEKLDAGPILCQEKVMLDQTETFGSLHRLLSELGAKNLLKTLNNMDSNLEIRQMKTCKLCSQNPKIDTKLDFSQKVCFEARVGLSAYTWGMV